MDLIVGLGNPGEEYEGTRHNIGFAVVDAIAEKWGVSFKRGSSQYSIARLTGKGEGSILLKPKTYMNRSGSAVQSALSYYGVDRNDVIVVVDDFHLPLGTIRLREKGSAGGHNGLSSVIEHLGTAEFKRIRCGIGIPTMPGNNDAITDFVLGRFRRNEQAEVKAMIERARDAAIIAVNDGFTKAMNVFNTVL